MLTVFQNLFSPPRHMVLLVIAAWIGLIFAEKRPERHGINRESVNNLIFYGLIAFLIGGRLSFILQNISDFIRSPASIFSINPDLFEILGALVAAVITAIIIGQKNQLPFWSALDSLTPFFATLAIGLGLSHLAAGTAFGTPTTMPWAINLWNANRHPTQIYEILAAILIFGLIWLQQHSLPPGLLFLTFVSLTAGGFIFIAAFRADLPLTLNGIKKEQVLALTILAASFILTEIRIKQLRNK